MLLPCIALLACARDDTQNQIPSKNSAAMPMVNANAAAEGEDHLGAGLFMKPYSNGFIPVKIFSNQDEINASSIVEYDFEQGRISVFSEDELTAVYTIDVLGRIISYGFTTDSDFHDTYAYNEEGLLGQRVVDNRAISYEYGSHGLLSSVYDEEFSESIQFTAKEGKLISAEDSDTRYRFNSLSNGKISTIEKFASEEDGLLIGKLVRNFDENGNPIKIQEYDMDGYLVYSSSITYASTDRNVMNFSLLDLVDPRF